MRGHIRERAPGVWALVLPAARSIDGKRRQAWHTIRGTRRDAERALRRLLAEREKTGCLAPARMTLAAFLDRWFTHASPALAPQSVRRYGQAVNRLKGLLGAERLDRLTTMRIQDAYAAATRAGVSAANVRYTHAVLHRCLEQACRWQIVGANPAHYAEPPKAPASTAGRSLTREEALAALGTARADHDGIAVILALGLGLRASEVRGLQWADVDAANGVVVIRRAIEEDSGRERAPKSGKTRVITLPAFVSLALAAERQAQEAIRREAPGWNAAGWVWPATTGHRAAGYSMSPIMKRICAAAGIRRIRFHDLRHSHASLLLSQGENVKAVSERLGHANVQITLHVYSHSLPGAHERLAETVDRLLR